MGDAVGDGQSGLEEKRRAFLRRYRSQGCIDISRSGVLRDGSALKAVKVLTVRGEHLPGCPLELKTSTRRRVFVSRYNDGRRRNINRGETSKFTTTQRCVHNFCGGNSFLVALPSGCHFLSLPGSKSLSLLCLVVIDHYLVKRHHQPPSRDTAHTRLICIALSFLGKVASEPVARFFEAYLYELKQPSVRSTARVMRIGRNSARMRWLSLKGMSSFAPPHEASFSSLLLCGN